MRGWFKAKDSYKSIPDNESYLTISPKKHKTLLEGGVVYTETRPRLLKTDFEEHLEACDDPSGAVAPEPEAPPEKSAEPSDGWTKDELKAYMDVNGIEYNSGDTKGDLLDKINEGGSK
ncbi:hypothetical protein CMO96_03895 [Candidatus Woesebacteria bacterium]|nr:hypothetical protein [Candidatus Woesebacteria bacterium]